MSFIKTEKAMMWKDKQEKFMMSFLHQFSSLNFGKMKRKTYLLKKGVTNERIYS